MVNYLNYDKRQRELLKKLDKQAKLEEMLRRANSVMSNDSDTPILRSTSLSIRYQSMGGVQNIAFASADDG